MPYTKQEHQQIAAKMPRDAKGHFVKKSPLPKNAPAKTERTALANIFNTSSVSHKDDLIDLRVSNPLSKIVRLLEDLKRQKAFSFTLKGSLGIMGVFLALSIFGIFGGGKLLCNKGKQTQIGTIKILQVKEEIKPPLLSNIPLFGSLFFFQDSILVNRIVLVKKDDAVIKLDKITQEEAFKFMNSKVIATGNFDSCSQSLKIPDQKSIELY